MMTPLPPENSRVKILLGRSYLTKKIFVKKKNIGRVYPGRGGVDTPPQKIVGLKLCWVVVSFVR